MSEIPSTPQPQFAEPTAVPSQPYTTHVPAPPVAYPAYQTPMRGAMAKSPALAGVLSALPGLGHVYLGMYQRALTFFAIFVACIAITDHSGGSPIGLMIPFWWFFVLIDAVRQAKAINVSGAPEANLAVMEKTFKPSGNLTLGVILILLGVFFLVNKFVTIDLSFLWDWSPLLLVAFGAWLVFSYYKTKEAETRSEGTSV